MSGFRLRWRKVRIEYIQHRNIYDSMPNRPVWELQVDSFSRLQLTFQPERTPRRLKLGSLVPVLQSFVLTSRFVSRRNPVRKENNSSF
jgi:hypothetical protein